MKIFKRSLDLPVILTFPKQQSCSLVAKMERTQIDEATEVGKTSVKYQKENSTTTKKAQQNKTNLQLIIHPGQTLAPHSAFLFLKLLAPRRLSNAATASKASLNTDDEELKQK